MPCVCGFAGTKLARHQKSCKVFEWHGKYQSLQEAHSAQVAELTAENERLVRELNSEKARPIVNNTTVVHDNRTINILPYGEEPVPARKDVLPLLYNPERSVARYIEMKHFSSRETANMRIPNKRARTMQLVEQGRDGTKRWVDVDRRETIERVTEVNLIELTDVQDAEQVPVWREWYQRRGLKGDGYDRTDAWRRLGASVENLLLSQRDGNVVA